MTATIASETDLNTYIAAANGGTSTDAFFQDNVTETSTPTAITSSELTLDGDNFSLTGDGSAAALSVSAGATVSIDNLSIANSGGAAIATGAATTVEFGTDATEATATSTISAAITGGAAVDVASGEGSGTLASSADALIFDAVNTYTGATTIDGYLALVGSGSIGESTSVTVEAYGVFDITGATATVMVNDFSGAADGKVYVGNNSLEVSEGSSTLTFAGVIADSASATATTGGLIVEAGTLELTGASSYTGATKVYGDLTIGSGGSILDTSNVSLKATGATLDVSAAGAVTINELTGVANTSVVTSSSGQALTIDEKGVAATFSGVISGAATVTLEGASELYLAGANTYTGATVIDLGSTLGISGAGSLTTSGVSGAGTLDISAASGSVTINNLTTTGAVKLGAERLILTGTADASTATTPTAVTGVISSTGAGSVQVGTATTGGVFTVTSAETYTGSTVIYGTLNLGRAQVVDSSTSAITTAAESGSIADSSNVSLKASTAEFDITNAFAGASTTTGTVTIGELTGTGGTVTLGSNSLDITEKTAASFSGEITGAGGFTVGGTETLTLEGTNNYSGGTIIDAGAHLALSGGGSILDTGAVEVGGVFDISGVDTGTAVANSILVEIGSLTSESSTVASEAGTVVLGGNTLEIAGSGDFYGAITGKGNLDVLGTGSPTVTLSGDNTYTGSTTVNTGATLAIDGGSVSGTTTIFDDGTITVTDATLAATSISGAGALTLTGGELSIASASGTVTLDVGLTGSTDTSGPTDIGSSIVLGSNTLEFGATSTFTGVISGNGGIEIDSGKTLTLSGAESYTGSTVVYGTLILDEATLASKNVSLKGSAILEVNPSTATGTTAAINELTGQSGTGVQLGANLTVTEHTAATYSGVISDGGDVYALTVAGTEALTLAGANTYTGATTIDSGASLVLTGSLDSDSLVDNGTFTVGASDESVKVLSGSGSLLLSTYGLTDVVASTTTSSTFSGVIHSTSTGELTINGATASSGTTTHVILSGTSEFSGGLVLDGGTVELSSTHAAGTGIITFATVGSGDSSVLEIDNAALSGTSTAETFGNTITQLSGGDIIDLSGLGYSSTGDASLTLTANNQLVVMENGVSVTLTIAGITAATLGDYTAYEDAHGGTYIELNTITHSSYYHP